MNEKTENLFANRSEFAFEFDKGVLMIEDLGGMKSVTNDIDNVISDIIREHGHDKVYGSKIIYKDSMGIWDGIKISKNGAISFFSLNEKDESKAVQKVLVV